ncbi:MAG: flagellar basal body P-ring formation chaperone FlgA [Candidatus Latescibacteria bacterium]|nr:flagellar basal body P-ring formation chaperone FlgA [Candidatus Latescibacterota bacterium]
MRRTIIYAVLTILWMLCLMASDGDAGVLVSEQEIHAAVEEHVREALSAFQGDIEVSPRWRGDLTVEGTGAVSLNVRPSNGRSNARTVPVVVKVLRGPVVVRECLTVADLRYYDDVAVAAQPLKRGDSLAGAANLERREVTSRLGRYEADLETLGAMRAKTRIPMGRMIESRCVEPSPAVERKDRVRLEIRFGALVASTSGVATKSGAIGDLITVLNLSSGEELVGEVAAPGVVRVVY